MTKEVRGGDYLFVYGSLRRGGGNRFAELLQRSGQLVGGGKVQGRLYEIAEYPGLVRSEDQGRWVQGEVYRLITKSVWDALDEYEGPDYRREIVEAYLDSGKRVRVAAYVYVRRVEGKREIESGDWMNR
jgi:pyruvate carboxylase